MINNAKLVKPLHFLILFLSLSIVLFSCKKDPDEEAKEIGEGIDPTKQGDSFTDISVPADFIFEMAPKREITLLVVDSSETPIPGVRFYLYESPDAKVSEFMASGMTDPLGKFTSQISLPQTTQNVYVQTLHKNLVSDQQVSLMSEGPVEVYWPFSPPKDSLNAQDPLPLVNLDFDGDGINDVDDLDDDNDGLLDGSEFYDCKTGKGDNVILASWYHTTTSDHLPTTTDKNILAYPEILGGGWSGYNYSEEADSRLDLMATKAPQTLEEAIAGDFFVEYSLYPTNGYVYNLQNIGFAWNDVDRTPKHSFTVSIFSNLDNFATPILTRTRPDDETSYREEGIFIKDDDFNGIASLLIFRAYIYSPTFEGNPVTQAEGDSVIIWDDFSLRGKMLSQCDADADGVANIYDLDSDGDLIPDNNDVEPLIPLFKEYLPNTEGYNSYVFESSWPMMDDYDFNDVVIDYRYELDRDDLGLINKITCHLLLRAMGSSVKNGFGLSFSNLTSTQVQQVNGTQTTTITLDGNGCESSQSKAVVIVYDDGHKLLGALPGELVNVSDSNFQAPYPFEIEIYLKEPKKDLGLINPFLFTSGERGREIHFKGFPPTELADPLLFNSMDDASSDSLMYQTKEGLPWGFDIPGSFAYPKEGVDLLKSYPMFQEWVESSGTSILNWYSLQNGQAEHIYRN
ncbi:MAG: LruC domain-containing protein [Bacteroidota bacterium]